MSFDFVCGQRLILELNDNSLFEGDYIKTGLHQRIDMANLVYSPSNEKINGNLSFYPYELRSIKVLKEKGAINKRYEDADIVNIYQEDYEHLKVVINNYIYMATIDARYLEGVKYLNTCQTIGVAALGSKYGRAQPIILLVLCSWDQIYIFDLYLYQSSKFPKELKELLECESIKKVVHDSRTLTDCLFHFHKVKLNNIFDTQIADLFTTKVADVDTLTLRPLDECLRKYLNFPSCLVEEANKVQYNEWKIRPFTNLFKTKAALLVVYLIPLKNTLENILLQDYNDKVLSNLQDCQKIESTTLNTAKN